MAEQPIPDTAPPKEWGQWPYWPPAVPMEGM